MSIKNIELLYTFYGTNKKKSISISNEEVSQSSNLLTLQYNERCVCCGDGARVYCLRNDFSINHPTPPQAHSTKLTFASPSAAAAARKFSALSAHTRGCCGSLAGAIMRVTRLSGLLFLFSPWFRWPNLIIRARCARGPRGRGVVVTQSNGVMERHTTRSNLNGTDADCGVWCAVLIFTSRP